MKSLIELVCLATIVVSASIADAQFRQPAQQERFKPKRAIMPQQGMPRANIIKPITVVAGVNRETGLKDMMPASGVITDRESWTKIYRAWRPKDKVPNVDFANQLVVVAMAAGPNRPRLGEMVLTNGDLNFTTISTRMGGPGFGYAFAQIPKAGIQSIKGKPIGAAGQGGQDSINVTVVGALQTGLMAIGGETTGTTITANGITWELDLQGDGQLIEAAKLASGNRARVRGTLSMRRGVEVRQRWIVAVESLRPLKGGPIKPGPIEPGPDLPAKPAKDQFRTITISMSGGIAGVNNVMSITGDGKVTNKLSLQRVTETWDMDREKLQALHALVGSTDWSKVPPETKNPRVADAFNYQFEIETKDGNIDTFSIDQVSLGAQPALAGLLKLTKEK